LLIRHEERCDRSNNPCLGPDNGITVSGGERAKEAGVRLKAYFDLDNTDTFSSPTNRTVQTSDFMLGKACLLSDREAICGHDIIDKLLKHKSANRNLLVMTHNTCMTDLIRTSQHKQSWSPEYGSLLFAKISSDNRIQIVGKLIPDDFPKQPSPI
jgi:broad specificity phosphatase PhoE